MPQAKQGIGPGNGPPNLCPLMLSVGPNTCHTTQNPTATEDIKAMLNSVMDAMSTEAFLTSKLLCHRDQSFTLSHLTSILFHITQMSTGTPLPVIIVIHAVAFILKKHTVCEIVNTAAKQLVTTIVLQLTAQLKEALTLQVMDMQATSEHLTNSIKQISETLTPMIEMAECMHRMLKAKCEEWEDNAKVAADRIEEAVNELHLSVEEYQKSLKTLTPSLDSTQDCINQLSTQLLTTLQQITPQTSSQPTYSSIITSHLPPLASNTLFPPNTPNPNIAKKLKAALTTIHTNATPPGDIRSVTSLHNGGIVVELEFKCLASWLGSTAGKTLLEG
ncbi:uncharacterized protein BJ212DRAFT_1479630 [Suillus subaureus]|uniref:Uncharacterized protein n=1 Tax=Suillus subaureus TaxID=48587 RepID=A0A9P7EDK5_9AGAM|nr:uncharacterized protein BJ212DRAFT_1479630 [Suillus subaureus]KAG1818630.1 hypothetical protein BJ212DRAFT_1479630 [Suillus subaureus]